MVFVADARGDQAERDMRVGARRAVRDGVVEACRRHQLVARGGEQHVAVAVERGDAARRTADPGERQGVALDVAVVGQQDRGQDGRAAARHVAGVADGDRRVARPR